MTFDELRAERPDLGFAVYAYEPDGPVTLEVLAAEGQFTFRGPTLADAIETAFPAEDQESEANVFS